MIIMVETFSEENILKGDYSYLPPGQSNIVRIFVSSTFGDFLHERNHLIQNVFPSIRQYCQTIGLEFQVVDMRWGVRDHSVSSHHISKVCLKEITICQQLSVGPSFIAFLGNRYGYRPVPANIIDTEFQSLIRVSESANIDISLLKKWYRLDTNSVPSVYQLQAITNYYPHYNDNSNKALQEKEQQEWWETHQSLFDLIKQLVHLAVETNKMTKEVAQIFISSVTEEEVTYGLLQDSSPNDHCLFYFRELNDIEANLADETTKKYIDKDSYDPSSCNKEAQQLLRDLKEIRIPARVSSENIHQYAIPWCRGGVDPSNENHASYLSSFCQQVNSDILRLINEAISKRSSFPAPYCLYEEITHHASFCISKCESFCGRNDVLNAIRELLLSKIRKPLVVYGVSGSGKTSVMAKVQQNACAWLGSTCVTVLRFLGTSPSSSGIRGTLSSICQQLSLIYHITSPNLESMEFNEIVQYFHSLLNDMLPLTIESHLLILLDSIDQLTPADGAHRMTWLPKLLPQNIHIIISMLPKEFGCLDVVHSLIPQEECYVETGAMSTCVGSEILDSWLSQAGRSLTKNQRSQVMRAFSLYPQPLFLRLLFHKTLTWFSYTNIDSNDLPRSTKDALNELFDQLQDHHGELLVSRSLGYFTSARNGLTETELEDVLSLDDEVLSDVYQYWDPPMESIIRIPQLVWKRVRYDISEFLVERQADGKTVIAWYHRQFIETTKNRYLKSDRDTKTCHLNLSIYFEGFLSTQTRPITLFHRKKTFYNISRQVANSTTSI